MNAINTTKDAVIASTILNALTTSKYTLLTAVALSRAANVGEADVIRVAGNIGLTKLRRRTDGAVMFGLPAKVSGGDVHHEVGARTTAAAAASVSVEQARAAQARAEQARAEQERLTRERLTRERQERLEREAREARAHTANANAAIKHNIKCALSDPRWSKRSIDALMKAGECGRITADAFAKELGARRDSNGFYALPSHLRCN